MQSASAESEAPRWELFSGFEASDKDAIKGRH
jgi:hypothetical protein